MIKFLTENYQWIIGAIIIPFIIYFLSKKREKIANFFKMEQRGGKNSIYYQAQKMIIKHPNLSVSDVKEIALSVFRENFPKLAEQAETKAKNNIKLFIDELDRKISNKLNKEEINKFRDPDIQYILYEAIKSNARKNSEELRRNLSALIIERIKNDDRDLKRIVYNEAIGTIGKLTSNQLKILTLCFLLRYTFYTGILDWEAFNYFLNTKIKPFLDFKDTNAEFQHIEYAGCGSIGIGSWNLIESIRSNYSFLFRIPIEKSEIDSLNLLESIKKEIFGLDREDKYFLRFRNKKDLEDYLNEKLVDTEVKNRLLQIYDSHIKSASEIKDKIIKETDIGEKMIGTWENKNIAHLSLTSVGIVIAASYYEQVIGEKIDINQWIN